MGVRLPQRMDAGGAFGSGKGASINDVRVHNIEGFGTFPLRVHIWD